MNSSLASRGRANPRSSPSFIVLSVRRWGESRREAQITSRQFSKYLRARLSGLELSSVDFEGASLRGAQLFGATFTQCNLRGADMRDASLRYSKIVACDLRNANFDKAELEQAQFDEHSAKEAGFKGAKLKKLMKNKFPKEGRVVLLSAPA
ncbi:pentapeptide repeat-containing protein [Bradyrhizobium sp. RT6a]